LPKYSNLILYFEIEVLKTFYPGLQRIIRAATPEDLVRFKRGFRRGYGGYKRGHGGYGGCGRCGGGGYGGGYGGGSFANSGASAGSINTPFGGGSFANSYANAG